MHQSEIGASDDLGFQAPATVVRDVDLSAFVLQRFSWKFKQMPFTPGAWSTKCWRGSLTSFVNVLNVRKPLEPSFPLSFPLPFFGFFCAGGAGSANFGWSRHCLRGCGHRGEMTAFFVGRERRTQWFRLQVPLMLRFLRTDHISDSVSV